MTPCNYTEMRKEWGKIVVTMFDCQWKRMKNWCESFVVVTMCLIFLKIYKQGLERTFFKQINIYGPQILVLICNDSSITVSCVFVMIYS